MSARAKRKADPRQVWQWPVGDFRRWWKATAVATSKDRRSLSRVQFRVYGDEVMLFATDSYLTCGAWTGAGARPDEFSDTPDRVFSFDDQWGVFPKWVKAVSRSYARARSTTERDVRLALLDGSAVFDRCDDDGNGADEVRFPLDGPEFDYPTITRSAFRPATGPTESASFGPATLPALSAIAKAACPVRGGNIGITLRFSSDPTLPQRWTAIGAPEVSGLVMPVRAP